MQYDEDHKRGHVEIVTSLSDLIDQILQPLITNQAPVALLDFPNHNNVGDNAIWLGELAFLERRQATVAYVCDISNYTRRTLTRALGDDGVILLHGGGNFGTLWPKHQVFRERIVREFPDHRIVQLPQTVDFVDGESLQRARDCLSQHRHLKVLARDRQSLRLLTEDVGVDAALCPDMAFALGCHERRPPSGDILWLARTDHESAGDNAAPAPPDVERVDWLRGEPGRPWTYPLFSLTVRARRSTNRLMERWSGLRRVAGPLVSSTFENLAWRRLHRGLRILSRGRVVVSDRLHGHILSLLLGIPHVLLDNRLGKVERFHRAFTSDCALCREAADEQQALELARTMVRKIPS